VKNSLTIKIEDGGIREDCNSEKTSLFPDLREIWCENASRPCREKPNYLTTKTEIKVRSCDVIRL